MFPRKKRNNLHPRRIPNSVLWTDSSFQRLAVKSGNAARFASGNSESLTIADNASLSMGDISFQMVLWVKFDSLPAVGSHMGVMGKWVNLAGRREYLLYINNSASLGNTTFRFQVRNTLDDTNVEVVASTFGNISTGVWNFVSVYHDATNDIIAISINDGTYDTVATSGGVLDGTQAFTIGGYDLANFMSGNVQWALVRKQINTSAETTWLYNAGSGRRFEDFGQAGTDGADLTVAGGIVAGWKLGEVSGQRNDYFAANHLTDNNTVTQNDGVALVDAVDGDYVRQWTDLSGNGIHLTQTGNVTTKPKFTAASVNGKPVIDFDGSDDFVSNTAWTALGSADSFTIFIVVSADVAAQAAKGIMNQGVVDNGWLIQTTTGNLVDFFMDGGTNDNFNSSSTFFSDTSYNIAAFTYNGTTKKIYKNGAANGSENRTTEAFAGTTTLQIGKHYAGVFNGKVAEVVIYNRVLNAGEMARVTRYLGWKYKIAVA